jgi:prefoldin subunit 5
VNDNTLEEIKISIDALEKSHEKLIQALSKLNQGVLEIAITLQGLIKVVKEKI